MSGEIGFESELGVGSTFWVVLNLPGCDHQALRSIQGENSPVSITSADEFRPLRILVAEDNKINQMVIKGL